MHPRAMLRQLTEKPLEKPCDTPWESMIGDDKVRRCGSCERDVYYLSAMSEIEAELRLLNAPDELPCIRYARDLDGRVLHRPPIHLESAYRPRGPARALVLASAIGGTLLSRDAGAKGKPAADAPTQCVMYAAEAPASAPASGAAPAPAPAAAPAQRAAAPSAKAAAAAPAPAPVPDRPQPLAGAPMPMHVQVASGTLNVTSKVPRELKVHGLTLKAPLADFRMTPGDFSAEVLGPGKKRKIVKFTIKAEETTTLNLD